LDTKKAASRIVAGDQLSDVFGVSDTQLQGIAALGYNLYQQGKLKDAETLFRGLVATNDKSWYGYAGLGAVALAKQPADLKAAQENLETAAKLNPKDPSVQANLGEVLLRQAKFDDAAKQFQRALELDPQQKDPGANRARAIIGGLNSIMAEVQRAKSAA
jgi:tetratricopeptide (TPR) repeat protein